MRLASEILLQQGGEFIGLLFIEILLPVIVVAVDAVVAVGIVVPFMIATTLAALSILLIVVLSWFVELSEI